MRNKVVLADVNSGDASLKVGALRPFFVREYGSRGFVGRHG
jgi:hypothetical protein